MVDNEDVTESHQHWLEHPYTLKVLRTLEGQEENLRRELFKLCAESSDPKVTAAFAAYTGIAAQVILHRGRPLRRVA